MTSCFILLSLSIVLNCSEIHCFVPLSILMGSIKFWLKSSNISRHQIFRCQWRRRRSRRETSGRCNETTNLAPSDRGITYEGLLHWRPVWSRFARPRRFAVYSANCFRVNGPHGDRMASIQTPRLRAAAIYCGTTHTAGTIVLSNVLPEERTVGREMRGAVGGQTTFCTRTARHRWTARY